MDTQTTNVDCNCKVGSIISRHEIENMNDKLVTRWIGANGDGESIRSLTDWLNQEVLRQLMLDAGANPIDGEVENLYQLLTDEDVLNASKIQARSSLSERGIDADEVTEEFISHQTVYRHLTKCLGAEKNSHEISVDNERSRVSSMQNRAEAVTTDTVSRLKNADKLALGDFEVLVTIRVSCASCGALHDVMDLVAQGGCDCQR